MITKEKLVLRIKKLDNFVSMPEYKTQGASAMDLVAAIDNDIIIPSGEIRMIPTGIAIELPHNTEAQVRSRSGLAIKSGIAVVNGVGTIDEDYRGEICVGLINHSKVDFKIQRGDRIAQMAIMEVLKPEIITKDELSETTRSTGGFGSTGIK
ncbi:MAG: dUTP diphosphatase [Candidatus Gastranaerophilales bacterium]|nr:dUTP diphosphatase [Candidatus Gastranaerophilales bacterium]